MLPRRLLILPAVVGCSKSHSQVTLGDWRDPLDPDVEAQTIYSQLVSGKHILRYETSYGNFREHRRPETHILPYFWSKGGSRGRFTSLLASLTLRPMIDVTVVMVCVSWRRVCVCVSWRRVCVCCDGVFVMTACVCLCVMTACVCLLWRCVCHDGVCVFVCHDGMCVSVVTVCLSWRRVCLCVVRQKHLERLEAVRQQDSCQSPAAPCRPPTGDEALPHGFYEEEGIASAAQLLDIVKDLENTHSIFALMETEKRLSSLVPRTTSLDEYRWRKEGGEQRGDGARRNWRGRSQ